MWVFSPYLFPLRIIFITNFLLFWFWYTLVRFSMCYPWRSLILNQSVYNFPQVWKCLSLFLFKYFLLPTPPPLSSHSEIALIHILICFICHIGHWGSLNFFSPDILLSIIHSGWYIVYITMSSSSLIFFPTVFTSFNPSQRIFHIWYCIF